MWLQLFFFVCFKDRLAEVANYCLQTLVEGSPGLSNKPFDLLINDTKTSKLNHIRNYDWCPNLSSFSRCFCTPGWASVGWPLISSPWPRWDLEKDSGVGRLQITSKSVCWWGEARLWSVQTPFFMDEWTLHTRPGEHPAGCHKAP